MLINIKNSFANGEVKEFKEFKEVNSTFANGEVKEFKEVREVKAICFTIKFTTQKAIGYNF